MDRITTMGIISDEVYNTTKGKDYFKDNPDDMIVNNQTYKVLEHTPSEDTGFNALLLEKMEQQSDGKNIGTGEYVIAFRGTAEKFDIFDDAVVGLKNYSFEFQSAKAWVEEVLTTKDKGYDVTKENLPLLDTH